MRHVIAAALYATSLSCWAQSYPVKPVRLVAPFPPGGTTDVLCRIMAQKLTDALGRQVVVENRPGAGSNVGAEKEGVARATLRRTLAGLGAQEVVTYTFTSDEEAQKARTERPGVRLRNPLTADRTGLRTALPEAVRERAAIVLVSFDTARDTPAALQD